MMRLKVSGALLALVSAALFVAAGILASRAKGEALLDKYLRASWQEQSKLRQKLLHSADKVIPAAVSRLKTEEFSRTAVPTWSDAPARHGAEVLRTFVRTEEHKAAVVRMVAPLLKSKDANDRGWSNYILVGEEAHFAGELADIPQLIRNEKDKEVLWSVLERVYDGPANNRQITKERSAPSDWRKELVKALGECLQTRDSNIVRLTAACLRNIPSPEATALAVKAIRRDPRSVWHFVGLLRQRIGSPHPAALSFKQQQKVLPVLIEMKMEHPDGGDDTLLDVIMDIPDRQVLPAFFEMLEKHKENRNVQRQVSYGIWILFSRYFREETPAEIYDFSVLQDPLCGAIWRRWYRENGDRLTWHETSRKYRLREKSGEPAALPGRAGARR